MHYIPLYRFRLTLLWLVSLLSTTILFAQVPWGGVNGSEWLAGKYNQEWLKINVKTQAIHRVTLPENFKNKQGQLHLYHRGVEIAMTSISPTQIEFYGIGNDGASDALLYRPYTGVRANPYYSWFSDESSYFLTYSNISIKSIEKQEILSPTSDAEPYHIQEEIVTYSDDYTHDERTNFVLIPLDQSYFSAGKAATGKLIWKSKNRDSVIIGDPIFSYPFQLKNLVRNQNIKPQFEILFNGRTFSNNKIKISIGKSAESLVDYQKFVEFSGFIPYKQFFDLDESTGYDGTGKGQLQIETAKVTNTFNTTGAFSVTYLKLRYPQSFDMSNSGSMVFNLMPTKSQSSTIIITNAPLNSKIYDVSDSENVRIIPGNMSGSTLNTVVARKANAAIKLLVVAEATTVPNDKVTPVKFNNLDPSTYDYLIISSDPLIEAANKYSEYRKSASGGNYKALSLKVTDVYNQFNYGEPSPVAIRRFTDYMVSNGIRSQHNLLLIGISTTIQSKMRLNRELKDEVPTIGYPGSDVLLVEGLGGVPADVPTIPVGRINAVSVDQVNNYLEKVKYYESDAASPSWKKRILHLNGGKTTSEVLTFKAALSSLVPIVETGEVGGVVEAVSKQNASAPTEKANISKQVNEGVGMISYLGHGDPTITDFDIGYISDATNSYQNFGKYPLLYFNGCGVGNIFSGRHNASPTAADRIPLSSDWINGKDKGSISIIANSYYSYAATSINYLNKLYSLIFNEPVETLSIGQIQQRAALEILSKNRSDYDVANIHQSLLQGDPAVQLVRVSKPDLAVDRSEGVFIVSDANNISIGESKLIKTGIIVSNGGRYFKEQKVPVQVTYFYSDGSKAIKKNDYSSIAFKDTLYVVTDNIKPLARIEVKIDPDNLISELLENNNISELLVDWELAKANSLYPAESARDNIAPFVNVTFNNVRIENDEIISPKPIIVITLTDNNSFYADTTLLDVFIKACGDDNCDFKRLSFFTNDIKITSLNSKSFTLEFTGSNMIEGIYELLVVGKDIAGNSNSPGYRVRFSVSDVANAVELIVSPNPATDYVRFKFRGASDDMRITNVLIFDLKGNIVKDVILPIAISEWYWIPDITSGLYSYKILTSNSKSIKQVYSGKIALIR